MQLDLTAAVDASMEKNIKKGKKNRKQTSWVQLIYQSKNTEVIIFFCLILVRRKTL